MKKRSLFFLDSEKLSFKKARLSAADKADLDRIASSDKGKRIRENTQEFSGAAQAGMALRMGFGKDVASFTDGRLTARVMAIMMRMIREGKGLRGSRPLQVVAQKQYLLGFRLDVRNDLYGSISVPFEISANADRTSVTLKTCAIDASRDLNGPKSATHFQLILRVAALSDHAFDAATNKYVALHRDLNGVGASACGEMLSLGHSTEETITLVADLGLTQELPSTAGLVCLVGVAFYQEVMGSYHQYFTGNAMNICAVC